MADGTPPNTPSRRGRKYAQVLAGAREVFLAAGFEGANVDDIVRAAGVSKATLYSYFPDKRLLFLEIAKQECAAQAELAVNAVDTAGPVESVLRTAARYLVDLTLSDFAQKCHRTCVGESDRFPDVAREYYASGPGLGRAKIAAYLDMAVARGEIAAEDTSFAADQFQALCKAGLHDRAMFQIETRPDETARNRTANEAVTTFLARYAARPSR